MSDTSDTNNRTKDNLAKLVESGEAILDRGIYEDSTHFTQIIYRNDQEPMRSFLFEYFAKPDGTRIIVTHKPEKVIQNNPKKHTFIYIMRREEIGYSERAELSPSVQEFIEFLKLKNILT